MPNPLSRRVNGKKNFKLKMRLDFIQLDIPGFMLQGSNPQIPMTMPTNRTKRQLFPTLHHKFGTNNHPQRPMCAPHQLNKRSQLVPGYSVRTRRANKQTTHTHYQQRKKCQPSLASTQQPKHTYAVWSVGNAGPRAIGSKPDIPPNHVSKRLNSV